MCPVSAESHQVSVHSCVMLQEHSPSERSQLCDTPSRGQTRAAYPPPVERHWRCSNSEALNVCVQVLWVSWGDAQEWCRWVRPLPHV